MIKITFLMKIQTLTVVYIIEQFSFYYCVKNSVRDRAMIFIKIFVGNVGSSKVRLISVL